MEIKVLIASAHNALSLEPLPEFSAADTQMLFEQDAMPMQLAALSDKEMRETEGAYWLVYVGGVFILYNAPRITQFGMNMLNMSAYQPLGHAFHWIEMQRVKHWPDSRWN